VLNDWNQDNPLVQQQWKDALKYWMTVYKVDGFRFDLVKGLGNNDSYGNTYNPATNMWGTPSDANTNRFNATRVARMKELHAAMKEVNPDAYFINENLAGAQEENDMAADGEINWANINTESRQFAMGYSSNSSLNRFYAPLDSRTWGSTVSYAESHDEERMAYSQLRQRRHRHPRQHPQLDAAPRIRGRPDADDARGAHDMAVPGVRRRPDYQERLWQRHVAEEGRMVVPQQRQPRRPQAELSRAVPHPLDERRHVHQRRDHDRKLRLMERPFDSPRQGLKSHLHGRKSVHHGPGPRLSSGKSLFKQI